MTRSDLDLIVLAVLTAVGLVAVAALSWANASSDYLDALVGALVAALVGVGALDRKEP